MVRRSAAHRRHARNVIAETPSFIVYRKAFMNDVDILVTAPLPPFLYEPLRADYRCHDYAVASDKPALLASIGPRVRGLVQGGGTVTPTSLLDALPALEIISVFGVGYDGVPVDYCRQRGLKVTNTPDVLTDDVADVAVALILMTGRGFVRANRFVHAGEWLRKGPELTTKLGGRTVGILGLGRIGKAIATRVQAMGMHVAYTGRKPQDVPYEFVSNLEALAARVDFLVVACPGGPATRHLVNERVLNALGAKGTLVYIARGSIVDEAALARALADVTI
jgi:lactate dehydrogenase-like 2-hydroxyacid dehydrogenase